MARDACSEVQRVHEGSEGVRVGSTHELDEHDGETEPLGLSSPPSACVVDPADAETSASPPPDDEPAEEPVERPCPEALLHHSDPLPLCSAEA